MFPWQLTSRRELEHLSRLLHGLLTEVKKLATAFEDLTREVEETGSVQESAIALLTGLSQQLKDALASGNVQAEVKALADKLDSQQSALAAAVEANTPAAAEETEP